jgi:hypothetical protein
MIAGGVLRRGEEATGKLGKDLAHPLLGSARRPGRMGLALPGLARERLGDAVESCSKRPGAS